MDSVFSNLAAGIYIAQLIDANFCTQNIMFAINETDSVQVTLSGTDISCPDTVDGFIQASAIGGIFPYQFSLDGFNFQDSSCFSPLPQGSYLVTVKDFL